MEEIAANVDEGRCHALFLLARMLPRRTWTVNICS
jgi:hypothetical protein